MTLASWLREDMSRSKLVACCHFAARSHALTPAPQATTLAKRSRLCMFVSSMSAGSQSAAFANALMVLL